MNRLPSRAGRLCSLAKISSRPLNLHARTPTTATILRPLSLQRHFHPSAIPHANPLPVTATGPPPSPPEPNPEYISAAYASPRSRLRDAAAPQVPQTRFWKAATPHRTDTHYEVHLDTRAVRVPSKDGMKKILKIPLSKPLLAYGIAIEWTLMRNNSEALKPHMIPLTSMASRAVDLEEAEASGAEIDTTTTGGDEGGKLKSTKEGIIDFLMGYLDTDTILLIAPTEPDHLVIEGEKTLRELQMQVAEDMISWMYSGAIARAAGDALDLPGDQVTYEISDGDHGIIPRPQAPETHAYLRNFIGGLTTWQLVGLERAVITGKSLLNGLRLVVENMPGGDGGWTIEDAAKATTLEVGYQTAQWGEVEDTHDVDIVDVRRGMGSVVLMVSEN